MIAEDGPLGVTVAGTQLETFSDSSGVYRLSNVPAGTAQVTYLYTGLTSQTIPITVASPAPTGIADQSRTTSGLG